MTQARWLLIGLMMLATLPAQAQAPSAGTPAPRFINPPGIGAPRGYTHVVEVTGPGRTIYIAGQLGYDQAGNVPAPGDFRAQATQVFENLKTALDSVCARFENVVKFNTFLTDIRTQLPVFREVRDKYVAATPPASTTVEIPRLAREGALLEVEAVAVLPPASGAGSCR
jgi:enamine deaminase RidA (YjgF/YER057c/UK114 family)